MNPIFKKILYIAGFISAVFILGFLIYWTFFQAPKPTPNENINAVNGGRLPNINEGVNRPVTNLNVNGALPNINGQAVAPTISPIAEGGPTLVKTLVDRQVKRLTLADNRSDLIYYDKTDGKFYRITADGLSKTQMTSDAFPEAEDIAWAPSKDKAIISFPDDSKILYDFTQRKQYSLPKETAEFSFSPNSDKIAFKYKGENRDDRWLAVSNPDGSEAAIIEPLGDKDNFVSVNWSPNDQVIATYQQSADANNSDIIFLGQHDENFKSASVAGRDFRGVWSPTGQKMVYSVYNAESNYSPKLWVMDAMGDNIGEHNTSLEIATWADKCTFSSSNSSNIYCAVPKYLEAGSGLYPELADSVPDDFYMINTTTGAKTLLAVPISSSGYNNFNAQDVYLSANEDYLYFTDKNTGKVIQIRLK